MTISLNTIRLSSTLGRELQPIQATSLASKPALLDKPIEQLLLELRDRAPAEIAKWVSAYIQSMPENLVKGVVVKILSRLGGRSAVVMALVLADLNRNAKPAAAVTVVEVGNSLLRRMNDLSAEEFSLLAKIAQERLNPTSADNGNCGQISAYLLNSAKGVSNKVPVWQAIAPSQGRSIAPNQHNLERVVGTAQFWPNYDPNTGKRIPLDVAQGNRIDDLIAKLDNASKQLGLGRVSFPGYPPSKDGKPDLGTEDNLTTKLSMGHSVNFSRTRDGQLVIVDGQAGRVIVGVAQIKKWLLGFTRMSPGSSFIRLPI